MGKKDKKFEQTPKKGKVKGKRAVIITVVLIIIIFFFAQLLYAFVLPRVTLDLKTVYHEATGGGGTGGSINVNTKIVNTGTLNINDCKITVIVRNSTGVVLTNGSYVEPILKPGASHELKMITNGNCYETFHIELEVEFFTKDNEYYERYLYKTHEDTMNIGFEDRIFDWGF